MTSRWRKYPRHSEKIVVRNISWSMSERNAPDAIPARRTFENCSSTGATEESSGACFFRLRLRASIPHARRRANAGSPASSPKYHRISSATASRGSPVSWLENAGSASRDVSTSR